MINKELISQYLCPKSPLNKKENIKKRKIMK